MSAELEAEIEDDVTIFATNRGWLVRKMVYPGRRGCPDRWFFKRGRLVIIEFKRPGEPPTGNQEREHVRFFEQGFHVHVLSDRDKACLLLEGTPYVKD
ncbi:hypothetical protein [Alterisphingorhabdus coralli]|uniref:VRR-NUC domain-containing protein n=1 Tax=Alterisphingorhabdus coralli TaxID=3071408 RepID=A0AA97I151_9SPHN|nr:hypothetical protein [Parasphingorhabdus sp. SCSIO 66989]WOE76369.1 hypothetical protein RB602_06550 [Parasphingorhabdus sp. SCSIO 66989]